jgi:hypothetical protein
MSNDIVKEVTMITSGLNTYTLGPATPVHKTKPADLVTDI